MVIINDDDGDNDRISLRFARYRPLDKCCRSAYRRLSADGKGRLPTMGDPSASCSREQGPASSAGAQLPRPPRPAAYFVLELFVYGPPLYLHGGQSLLVPASCLRRNSSGACLTGRPQRPVCRHVLSSVHTHVLRRVFRHARMVDLKDMCLGMCLRVSLDILDWSTSKSLLNATPIEKTTASVVSSWVFLHSGASGTYCNSNNNDNDNGIITKHNNDNNNDNDNDNDDNNNGEWHLVCSR